MNSKLQTKHRIAMIWALLDDSNDWFLDATEDQDEIKDTDQRIVNYQGHIAKALFELHQIMHLHWEDASDTAPEDAEHYIFAGKVPEDYKPIAVMEKNDVILTLLDIQPGQVHWINDDNF